MRVPITSIISMGGIQKYPDLTKALSGLDITATVGLSVLLTYERYHIGESSQYYKYLMSLPQAFGTVQYWQEDELKTLDWVSVIEAHPVPVLPKKTTNV